jgi:hypothetical protein
MPALKDIDKDAVAYSPHAFYIEELLLTNKDGIVVDIQNLQKEIVITESIYSPTMILSVSIKDESNLIETMPIFGFETVFLKMRRKQGPEGAEQFIERLFYVTEFPLYGKARNENVQVYTLTAVSYHAWKNPLIKISRFYYNFIADEIAKIADDAFGLKVLIKGGPDPKGRGIINVQSPLQAIDWFRRRLHEKEGQPFYFYEVNQNKPNEIYLESHTEIAQKPVHYTYYETRMYNEDTMGTQKDYDEKKAKIVESTSELKLSKFIPMPTGTWGSENNYLDVAKREFFKKFYDYPGKFPLDSTIYGTNILEAPADFEFPEIPIPNGSPEPIPNEEKIEEEYFAYQEHMSLNSEAWYNSKEYQNYNQWSHEKVFVMNAFPGVFNTLVHEVKVYGDFELNAGKTVELFFPKSADPDVTGEEKWDKNLSGKYVVISAMHRFKDQEYFTEIKVKRDSFVK